MSEIKAADMKKLFNRVYNDQMIVDKDTDMHDSDSIKAVCAKVFGDGNTTPDPSLLHQFNNLVVETASEIAQPKVTDLLKYLANYVVTARGDVKMIKTPRRVKAKVVWSANGSGVDLIRVSGAKEVVAVPQTFSTGFYYEPLDLVKDSVDSFQALINDVAEAKMRLYMSEIAKLTTASIANSKIPSNNVIDGSNTSIVDYNRLVGLFSRYGGVPVLVADALMVNDLAMKQVTDPVLSTLLSDSYKDELLKSLNITTIGRSVAVNLVNPFINDTNSAVELDPREGYMFTGEGSQKPFSIVEYGTMRQQTETNIEDERVKVKLSQDASIILVYGQLLGFIKDDSISL